MVYKKLREKGTDLLRQIRELQGEPSVLARGMALGVFIGFAPLLPLKTALILSIGFLIRGNVLAGILSSTVICNPFTYIPLYYLAWKIGNLIMPGKASWPQIELAITRMQQSGLDQALAIAGKTGVDTIIVVLTGGCLMALPPAVLCYPFALKMFTRLAQKRAAIKTD